MRLLITVGYQKVLFPSGANVSAIIQSIEGAQLVDETYNSGVSAYKPSANGDIEVKLIPDGDVRLPDVERPEAVTKLLEIAAEKSKLEMEVYTLKQRLSKFERAVEEASK